jgi:pseudouridine-5'-phosphate glycosidase
MLSEVTYDSVNNEWRCEIDEYTVVITPSKEEMELALDKIEGYINESRRQSTQNAIRCYSNGFNYQ